MFVARAYVACAEPLPALVSPLAVRGMAIQERRTITRSHEDNNGDNCATELSKEYDICMARKEGYAFWYAGREEAAGAVVQNASCSWAKW